MHKNVVRLFGIVVLFGLMFAFAACAGPTPQVQVVESTKLVQSTTIVESTKLVEVEVEKIVEVTAAPSDVWSYEKVMAASGPDQCKPLAQLPMTFKQPFKIGFVGANNGNPFHGAFQKGAKDAAAFYGVEFVDMDAAGGTNILDLATTMLTQDVRAMGVMGQGMDVIDPVGATAQEAGVLFIPADSGKTEYSPYTYGVSDTLSGKRGGELLAEGVKMAQQEGAWKDKDLFFIETTHTAIPACVARTGGAAKAFKEIFSLADDHVLKMDMAAGTVTDMMKAILTSNPDAVFGMIPCWDQLGVDPWNAANEAGRGDDVMLVTLGGDKPYADLLVSKPANYYGYVEFQPYCEGWGWTETALAALEGVPFTPYVPRLVTTQENIEARYIELYGALPTPTK